MHVINFSSVIQVDREFCFTAALHKVDFPVPKPLLFCSDTSVVGTEFYIMEHVKVTSQKCIIFF